MPGSAAAPSLAVVGWQDAAVTFPWAMAGCASEEECTQLLEFWHPGTEENSLAVPCSPELGFCKLHISKNTAFSTRPPCVLVKSRNTYMKAWERACQAAVNTLPGLS